MEYNCVLTLIDRPSSEHCYRAFTDNTRKKIDNCSCAIFNGHSELRVIQANSTLNYRNQSKCNGKIYLCYARLTRAIIN